MKQMTVAEFCGAGDLMLAHRRVDGPVEAVVAVDGNLVAAKVTVAFDDQDRYARVVIEPDYDEPTPKRGKKR